jgi:hypothetical protein
VPRRRRLIDTPIPATLAERYAAEWAMELRRQGIEPNGATFAEREASARLAEARGNSLSPLRTPEQALSDAAAAFERAKGIYGVDGAYGAGCRHWR